VTLQHYFEAEGHEVLYRKTPEGPDVVAVGPVEIQAFRKALSEEEQDQFIGWLP